MIHKLWGSRIRPQPHHQLISLDLHSDRSLIRGAANHHSKHAVLEMTLAVERQRLSNARYYSLNTSEN